MKTDLFTEFVPEPATDILQNFVWEVQDGIYTEDVTITECRLVNSEVYSLEVNDEYEGEMLFLGLCY